MDFERKTVVRAICLNRNPQFRTSKHCPLACVFGISVGVVQNPKLWILEIGSEFRNLDFARTLFRYPYRVIFGISVGGNIHGPSSYRRTSFNCVVKSLHIRVLTQIAYFIVALLRARLLCTCILCNG